MRKLVLTCIVSGLFISTGFAQALFTFGNNPVSKEEFVRVYQKNTINRQPDMSAKALREYMNLYALFRMKVKEAEYQRLDTNRNIELELNNYRKQLAKKHLTDENVTNELVREAYDRMKQEIHVAHILISMPQYAGGADTVAAYREADSLYNALTRKKADFAALARNFSDDNGSKEHGGDIGYVTALQTIYPFENMVYSTSEGKVSRPFRTQFGYHIVKVLDKREARGELKVAQILVTAQKSQGEAGLAAAKKRVTQIMSELKKGASFESLVEKYSDDKYSKDKKGVLPVFGVGKMTPAFEEAAFALKQPGDVSDPVQTDYGFHIIKLIEREPLKPYDSLYAGLKRDVENDARAKVAKESFFNKIKSKNGFKEYAANYDELAKRLEGIPDAGEKANMFAAADFGDMKKPLFDLAGTSYRQSDFMHFAEKMTNGRLMGARSAVLRDLYRMYVTNVVNDFEEHRLVEEHPEISSLMREYRDGIMLFELMDRNVWGKASKDTVGLKAFYERTKENYKWEPGFTGAVYKFKNEEALKQGMKLLAQKDLKEEDVIKKMNTEGTPDAVSVQRGHFEFNKFSEVPRTAITKAKPTTEPKKNDDGTYTVVKVNEVFNAPTTKTLDEARGYVVAEYQDYLEKKWNEDIREKYPLKIDEAVFSSIVQP